jgi:hypothetical protein
MKKLLTLFQKDTLLFWLLVFVALSMKNFLFGFLYFPTLDDYNQYGYYSYITPDHFIDQIRSNPIFGTRPFATTLDLVLWSRFWPNLNGILLFFSFLQGISLYFAYYTFKKIHLEIGIITILCFILIPMQVEATYWISASSRLVVGFFFLTFSLYLLSQYFDAYARHKKWAPLFFFSFAITNLCSMGFYEQYTSQGFILPIALSIYYMKKMQVPLKNALIGWIPPIFNVALIALYYLQNLHNPNIESRGNFSSGNFFIHILYIGAVYIKQIFYQVAVFFRYQLFEGLKNILQDGHIPFMVFTLFLAFLFFFISKKETLEPTKTSLVPKIGVFFLVLLSTLCPFIIYDKIFLFNRNLFPSLLVLCMMAEVLTLLFLKQLKLPYIKPMIVFFLTCLFLTGTYHELRNYKELYMLDQKIISSYIKTTAEISSQNKSKTVILFNTKPNYSNSKIPFSGNCTSSGWALFGAVYATKMDLTLWPEMPVENDQVIAKTKEELTNFYYMGLKEDFTIDLLNGQWRGDSELLLYLPDGTLFGRLIQKEQTFLYQHQFQHIKKGDAF